MGLLREPLPGIKLDENQISQNIFHWIIEIEGVPGTLYENESFQLQFKFNSKYPFDSPEVSLMNSSNL
jgi:ubiquitin-conjugating enzyme E2 W